MASEIVRQTCWGIIPARGGSKSIPLKNLHPFAGRPLIDYVIDAGQKCEGITELYCSTDHPDITTHCDVRGVTVHHRPEALSGDKAKVTDVLVHFLEEAGKKGTLPEYIALLQPTSPFLRAQDITACITALETDKNAASSQTVIECPHNHHAVNQRKITGNYIEFLNREARARGYNKQHKASHYLFGNLVVTRTTEFLAQQDVFALPSVPITIDMHYGFDADNHNDFRLGQLLLENGIVQF